MSAKPFKRGDRVTWSSAAGEIAGSVERNLTEPVEIKGHHVAASPDNPEVLVRSEKTGARAAHKPDALEKKR
jgi:hypothetical protein